MTTIAANLRMMAADTEVSQEDQTLYHTHKLFRFPGVIIGPAGDNEACQRFMEWWVNSRPKGVPLQIPKRLDFDALVLNAEGLWRFGNVGPPDKILTGYAAIGSGEHVAHAAFDTMVALRRAPDPRIAVAVACNRAHGTGGNVEFLRLRKR